FYLASRSICQGRSAGFTSLLGVCFGMFIYMLATTAGLSALFVAMPVAYDVVRYIGASYLLWLAFKAFTRPAASFNSNHLASESQGKLTQWVNTNPSVSCCFEINNHKSETVN
ncbi:MAG: LysE family translocator, partial [Gammaproteobacteria bacterium]|nr:LysE family translocator [Gammaproteobacteria bacterium]